MEDAQDVDPVVANLISDNVELNRKLTHRATAHGDPVPDLGKLAKTVERRVQYSKISACLFGAMCSYRVGTDCGKILLG
jgi:hypothetical protein